MPLGADEEEFNAFEVDLLVPFSDPVGIPEIVEASELGLKCDWSVRLSKEPQRSSLAMRRSLKVCKR